ncbi:hypothetical protein [Polaromonas sp. YR568]|uniref:hypothetical protein n=1 Tax=Polaromonas sp. YR568 TaxID=1855301 RepID=UPI000B8360E9|nr:hypothetical protein [Polaromonas sp. YR568]
MIDQPRAAELAREAFDQWEAGHHEQSRLLYEAAIPLADPQHWGLSAYHGEYACVLNELGKHDQATVQLKKSLAAELTQGNAEGAPAVLIARYFLAEQLLRHGAPELALEALTPSTSSAPNHWLTRVVEAHVLFALNRRCEAKVAAALAISNAPTPAKGEELKLNLGQVLSAPDE